MHTSQSEKHQGGCVGLITDGLVVSTVGQQGLRDQASPGRQGACFCRERGKENVQGRWGSSPWMGSPA